MEEKKLAPTIQPSNDFWNIDEPKEGVQQYDSSLDSSFNEPSSSEGLNVPQDDVPVYRRNLNLENEAIQDATTAWRQPEQPKVEIDEDMNWFEMAGKSFVVGLGDMVDSFGDIADFMGGSTSSEISQQVYGTDTSKPISDSLHGFADYLQSYGDDVPGLADLENVTWDDLSDIDFWGTGVARMLPFALSLMIPATGAAKLAGMATKGRKFTKAAAAIAKGSKSIGITKYADPLVARGLITAGISTVSAGATANLIEGAALAGQTLNEGVKQGLTEAEAMNAASLVYRDNLASMGADIVQYGLFMGQMGIGKGAIASAQKLGAKFAGTSTAKAVAGVAGKAAAKSGVSALKAPGMKDVIRSSFKAIGMGAIHGITDGVVEQFQEVFQDWSVQRRIAEAKGEGDEFPDYLDFFLADEQRPTRVLSFATSLLMSGASNTIRTATENRTTLQTAIDERNESHEMIKIFEKDLDEGVYRTKRKVNVTNEDGTISQKEVIEELNAEEASNWGRDAAAHTMILNAVKQGDEQVILDFFQSKLDSGNISEEQHSSYKGTFDEIKAAMDGKPSSTLDNKGKTELVYNSWLNSTSKVQLNKQKEALQAQIDEIQAQVDDGPLDQPSADIEINGLKELTKSSLQAQEEIVAATESRINEIYSESKVRTDEKTWKKDTGKKLESIVEKELKGEDLTAEELALTTSDDKAKEFYSEKKLEGQKFNALKAAKKKAGRKFKGHKANAASSKDGTYVYTKRNEKDNTLSVITVSPDGSVEMKTDTIDENLSEIEKKSKEKSEAKTEKEKALRAEKEKAKDEKDEKEEKEKNLTEKNSQFKGKVISPSALALANKLGIDLEESGLIGNGKGKNGRLTKADIENYKPEVKAEEKAEKKVEEKGKETIPKYLTGSNLKATAKLALDATTGIIKAFFNKERAVRIVDKVEAALHRRKIRRAYTMGKGSQRTLANLYAKKSADGLISVQFLDEIYSRGDEGAAYAMGLGVFINPDAATDSAEEAIFHENFHIFRMLYGHLKEVKDMMLSVVGQPVYKTTKLDYQEELLYFFVDKEGNKNTMTQEEALEYLKLKQENASQQELFNVVTSVEKYALDNGKDITEKLRKEFYESSLNVLTQAGFVELKEEAQVHIQDEALAKLGGLYGSVNQDLFISGQNKTEYNSKLKAWKEKIKDSVTKEEAESAFEAVSKGLYKANGEQSLEEQFKNVNKLIADNKAKYGAYTATTQQSLNKKLLKQSRVIDEVNYLLNDLKGSVHQRAKAFVATELDVILKVDKKKDFTVNELSKYIQEKLLLTESINKSYVDIASDVLSDYYNTKDYKQALQLIRNNEGTIKALIRNQHLTGLTAEASKVLSKKLSESDNAYLKALEAKFSKAQKEVLSTDNNGDKLSIDADDIFSAMIDDNPQQLSDKLYSILEFHLQIVSQTYRRDVIIGKDKLLFHIKSFAQGKTKEEFVKNAYGLIDALRLQEAGKSFTFMENNDEHVARFLTTLVEQHELMPKTAIPYTKKGANMAFGSVLGGLYLQMNSMTTEKGLFLTADGYAPALSRQDANRVQTALKDAVMFGSEFLNKQRTGNVPLGLLTENVNATPTNERQAGMLSQLRKRILYTRNLARLVYAPKHTYEKGQRDKDLLHFINAFFLPFGTNESGASFNFNELALDEFRIYDEETKKNLTLREYFEGDRLKALYNQSISFDLAESVKNNNISLEDLKKKANADVFMPFFIAKIRNKIGGDKIQDNTLIDKDIMSQIRDDFDKQIEDAYNSMDKFPADKVDDVKYVQTLPEAGLTNSPKGPEYQRNGKVTRQIKLTELKTEEQKEAYAKKNGLMSFSTSGIQPGEKVWEREIVKEWKTSERGSIAMYTVIGEDGGKNNSSSLNDLQGHKKLAQAVIATFNSEHNEGYMSTILTPEDKTLNLNTRKYFLEYNADSLRDFMNKGDGMAFAELFSYEGYQNPYAMRALEDDYKLEFLSLLGDSKSELDRQNISSVGITEGDINEINRALKSGSKEYNQVVRDYSDKSRRYYAKATLIPADNQYNLEGGVAIFIENAVSNRNDFTEEQLRAIDKHLELMVDITATKSQKLLALNNVKRKYVMAVTTELQAKMDEVVDYHNAKTREIIANHNSNSDFDLFKVTGQATIDSLLSEGYKIKNSDTQKSKVKGELNLLGKLAFQQTINGKIQYLNNVETHVAMMDKLGRSPLDAVSSMNYFTNKFWLQDLNANTMEEQNFSMKNKRSTGLIAPHDSSYSGNRVETIIFDDQDLEFENESQKVQIFNYETGKLEEVTLTPKLADSASYITQEEATRLEGNHGGLSDVKGSFKLVGYGRNVDNKRIASHTGQKSNQFYFKGHTIVLNNKVRGPLSGVYKSLKAREKFYSDKGLKNHRVLSYADSGVKKFNIKGVNTFSLKELNDGNFDLNGRLDKWSYDEVNKLRGFDGRFFGVQNELDKEANSATVAKQGISNMNVFADHWDTNVQGLSQKVMNAYALALDLQYEEEIASLTYEGLAKQDMESSSMPPVQAVMFQEGNDSLPTIRARVLELANSKLRKKGFKLRTEGTLSLQESDIIQGFEMSGEGKLVETDKALKPISVSGTEGNLKVSHAEASISQHMAKMLGVTKEDVEKARTSGEEILFLATRIPASSAGSTVVLRVAKISDKQGNTIAVNSKTSSIMGADLDGDMLHINIVETGKDLTDLQNAKNNVIQSIIDLYSEPSVVNMLIQEIEIESTTKSSNLALFGNEEGSTEVNNDLGLLGASNIYETTKGNVPMIGIIASQNLMYNYISQGNPELLYDGTAIEFQIDKGFSKSSLGLDFYSNNKKLSEIGTAEEYSEFLETVFPNSEVKDVVYRGSDPLASSSTYQYFTTVKGEATLFAKANVPKSGIISERNPTNSIDKNFKEGLKNKYDESLIKSLYHEPLAPDDFFKGFVPNAINKLSPSDKSIFNKIEKLKRMYDIVKIESESDAMKPFDDTDYRDTIDDYKKLLAELKSLYFKSSDVGKVQEVLLNIKNSYKEEIVQEDLQNNRDAYKNGHDGAMLNDGDHFLVKRDTNQIHELGSEKDIQGFNNFVASNKSTLTTLDNVVKKDGTGTYYEVCKYLNLVLDDGKNNNRANFQFIKETAGQFIMMMKYGIKPAQISTYIRDMNWAALKGLNSKEIYDRANEAAMSLDAEYNIGGEEPANLSQVIQSVFGGGVGLSFNIPSIAEESKNDEKDVNDKAMLLYYVTSQIGQDLKDLSLFVGLDKKFTANPLDNLIQHQAALEALKVQPSIDERLRAKNPLYKRQLETNEKLIQKAIDESAELSNGYAEGLLGDYNFEEVKGTSGILGIENIQNSAGEDIPLGIFNKNLNGLVSDSDLISQLTKALTLSRALIHAGYDVSNKILQLGGMFKEEMGLKYEEFAALPTNAGKLVHLTTAAGNVAKAFQNDNSNNQNKWLGADGILKIMPTKGYITEKGKTQIADYIKFDIDVAKLQRELEFTEHVDIYRKDFEKLPESLKRFLVFNDLLSTGWGSKNPGKSMIPYMSAAYSSKVNSMFSVINDPAVSNFTDDMAIMKEKLSHIMNFTGDNELDNRRIALVLQIGLNGPNAKVTTNTKTGESTIRNKHNGGLFTVTTNKIGANPLNQVSEIKFDKQATSAYRDVNPSETFPFQYGKGIPYFNQFPELSMLNTMEALTKVKHAENGTSVHEVSKGPKKKFLKIASHSRDHFGDTGVAYTKNEYAAKVLLKGQKIEDLSENMQEDLDLRFKVYEESVKRAAEINKEISKELDDTIYRLDHNNKEKSKKALDKKFEDVRDIYTNLRDVIDKSTVVIGKESYKLDSMAFDTLLRLAQHNFGNHIAEKQITDWEYAHGKKFVETVINEQHKKSKDISRLNLWMSPGDFGKTKPAIAYINKNIKMTHMKYTRNISLVAKEMNDKLDSLFKHKFGSDLAAKGIKAFMAYMPIGTMGYSEKLFENFYKSYTGLEKITDKEGVVSYRDRSNLELHPDLFNKGGKYGNTISLKKEGKKYKNLHESEKEYIEMYVKYTNFYKELIKAKNLYKTTKGANYVANINSSTWETYHRRGLFGMYYQMFKGDEMLSDVMIKGVNPITGEPATLDYFSWKAIFMHAPGESFKISRAQIVKGGVKMISSKGNSKQVMTGTQRVEAYRVIQKRAQELWDNKKDDNDNDINVTSPVNDVMALESEEAVNRYVHSRSMTSGYLATHNIHQALNTYVRDFMFLHGNMFYDPKAKVWNTLSWAGNDKALEHSYISDKKVTDSRYSGLKHIRSNEGDASLKDYKLAFSGFNDKTAEIDAAMSSLGDNHINARKFLQKVVKEGFLIKEKNLTLSDSSSKITRYTFGQQPEKVLANFFTQWTMYIALGFNIPAAKGNVLIGKYNAYRQAGGKALIKGEARYWGLSSDKIYDNSARLKARKMIDELGILTYRAEELAEGLGASSLSSVVFYPMVAAENWIQQAQFLGQLTQKQWDGYFIDKNGDLKFNGAEEDRLTQQDVATLERKVIDVQGRGYSETDVRYIQLFSLGTMAMQFKRWFPTFLADRFKSEDVDDLGNLRMGSIIGARKFIDKMHKEGKLWKFSEFRKELNENFKPHEREAVMRVMYGTNGIMVASLLYAIAIATNDDDEPEDETAKLFEKLLGDMLLLGNVPKLTYMTNIPATDTIENLALALYHTAKQTEYQRKAKYGDKGDLKSVAHFARLLPAPLRKPLQLENKKDKRQRPLN